MTVKLAKTAGFCYGVKRALSTAIEATHKKECSLQTFGPLIHNKQVIDLLRSKNIEPVKKIGDITSEKVLIRAHGVSPEVIDDIKKMGIDILDATCPHVSKAQHIIDEYTRQGFNSIIIGDKGHAEVVGLLGYAQGKGYVVENEEDVDLLPDMEKICVIAQTTQSEEKFDIITEKIKQRWQNAIVYNTICKATSQRQKELTNLAKSVDLMVVVGDCKSANTNRLVELSKETGTPTIHIETAEELDLTLQDALKFKTVGVTAGASTPYWVIRNVVEELEELQRKTNPFLFKVMYKIVRAFTYSHIFLAIGAASLTFVSSKLINIQPLLSNSLISFFYILSMHLLNKYLSLPQDRSLTYGPLKFFTRHEKTLFLLGAVSILGAFFIALRLSIYALALMLLSLIAGIVYSVAIFPKQWTKFIRYRSLKEIPGSKDVFTAIGWVIVVVLLPFFDATKVNTFSLITTAMIVFSLVLSKSILYDLREIEGDITIGRETLPVFMGSKNALTMSNLLLYLAFFLPVLGSWFNLLPPFGILFSIIPIYAVMIESLSKKFNFYHSWSYDICSDSQFVIAGLIGLLI